MQRIQLRRQIAVGSAVVVLHAVLWWLVRPPATAVGAAPPERMSIVLALPRSVDVAVRAPDPDASDRAVRRRLPPAVRSPRSHRADEVSLFVPGPAGPSRAAAGAEAAGATASQPLQPLRPLRPLDLTLRGGMQGVAPARNPALDDARANTTARAAPEARMAQRLSQVVHEELHEDGSVRITRGDDCVDLKPSRASQLFATDSATRPMPRLASACP